MFNEHKEGNFPTGKKPASVIPAGQVLQYLIALLKNSHVELGRCVEDIGNLRSQFEPDASNNLIALAEMTKALGLYTHKATGDILDVLENFLRTETAEGELKLLRARVSRLEGIGGKRRLDLPAGVQPEQAQDAFIDLAAAVEAGANMEERVGNTPGATALRKWFETSAVPGSDRGQALEALEKVLKMLQGADREEIRTKFAATAPKGSSSES